MLDYAQTQLESVQASCSPAAQSAHLSPAPTHESCYARRMGQPTQRATNSTARSTIEPAQIFLHANCQSAPRLDGARDVGRGAGSHTPSTASESFSPPCRSQRRKQTLKQTLKQSPPASPAARHPASDLKQDVISRQQNLTPERRRGESGKETKKQEQRDGGWGPKQNLAASAAIGSVKPPPPPSRLRASPSPARKASLATFTPESPPFTPRLRASPSAATRKTKP